MNFILSLLKQVRAAAHLIPACALASAVAAQLTPADIPGPDGYVYPDFRRAGVQGGIPNVTNVYTTLSPSGDDATAIENALANAGAAGGGVVLLNAGNYHLNRFILARTGNVVLRGSGSGGANATNIYFDYAGPTGNPVFYNVSNGSTIDSNTWILGLANPTNLSTITLQVDGLTVSTGSTNQNGHYIPEFTTRAAGSDVINLVGANSGTHTLTLQAAYTDGTTLTTNISVTVAGTGSEPYSRPYYLGAINFIGGNYRTNLPLAQGASRGATQTTLQPGHGLVAGNRILLTAPATTAWSNSVNNACTYCLRQGLFIVTAVNGNVITLNQPLRIDFPIEDAANPPYVQRLQTIQSCGVENLYIRQTQNIWTSLISFTNAENCWARNLNVQKPGRFPVTFQDSKFCTIYNNTFNDAWWHGDGGTAYGGWDACFDCLMDTITTYRLRHAPLFQWSSSGCVIRNGIFNGSDCQHHAGWTHEDLLEQCYVDASQGDNSYGYGVYTTWPSDAQHGPIGPRNVIYNNDITSPLDGCYFGGQNQGWIVNHNRFGIDVGNFVALRLNSSGHMFNDNVVCYGTPFAGLAFATSDCTGVALTNSLFNGLPTFTGVPPLSSTAYLAVGSSTLATNSGNTATAGTGVTNLGLPDGGFESVPTQWSLNDAGTSTISSTSAYSGTYGLNVNTTGGGSDASSSSVNVQAGCTYQVQFVARTNVGGGIGIYPQFLVNGAWANATGFIGLPASQEQGGDNWDVYSVIADAPSNATQGRVWIHAYSTSMIDADFDNFSMNLVPQQIRNKSFETGNLTGWNNAGDNGLSTVSTTAAKVGTYGLQVSASAPPSGSSLYSNSLPVVPGYDYQVRFWAEMVSGSGMGVYLNYYDGNGTLLGSNNYTLGSGETTWKQRLLRATAPATAATAKIWLHSYNNATVTAYFDDFEFLELRPRPAPTYSSIYAWEMNPSFALTNPGFETGDFTGWSTAGDNNMSSVTTTAAHTGSYGLHVVDTSTVYGSSVTSVSYPVVPGANYKATFYGRADTANAIGVYLNFRDANNNLISGAPETTLTNSGSTWMPYSVAGTAPANAASVQIWIHSFNATTVTADLDDFTVSPVLPPQ